MPPLFEWSFCKSTQIWFIIKKQLTLNQQSRKTSTQIWFIIKKQYTFNDQSRKTSIGQSALSLIGPTLWNIKRI